jgi:soluble lytic murein transglycosylase-like protein
LTPPSDLVALAKKTASDLNLYGALVCAIVEQESSWDPWSMRYEPDFRARYVAPLGLPPTAEIARSISWGLMQLMGEAARELGFNTGSLAQLCDPATGLYWGCRAFSAKLKIAGDDESKALELWNGGGNPNYAAQVLARVGKYSGE